ncbi:hypothetical protein [Oligoflexus tunisiensis]|nr:hypothetical protein [Oligoflexus tunisiensis]
MGTQIGNATPLDVAAAASDERVEDNGSEPASFTDSTWAEDVANEF